MERPAAPQWAAMVRLAEDMAQATWALAARGAGTEEGEVWEEAATAVVWKGTVVQVEEARAGAAEVGAAKVVAAAAAGSAAVAATVVAVVAVALGAGGLVVEARAVASQEEGVWAAEVRAVAATAAVATAEAAMAAGGSQGFSRDQSAQSQSPSTEQTGLRHGRARTHHQSHQIRREARP